MPSTLPPPDASSEWGHQSEPAVRVAGESDPSRQALPHFGPSRSQPLLPGHAGGEPGRAMAGERLSTPGELPPPLAAAGQSGDRPEIAPELWVAPEDVWNTSSFKALSGGRQAVRPTRPLPRPERFRRVPRWRSYLYLGVLLVVIAIVAGGTMEVTSLAKDVFGQPARSTQPVPTHTATPLHTTPTVKPRK